MEIHDFIKKYLKGVDLLRVDEGIVPLEYQPFQKEVIDVLCNNKDVIIKKSRQMYLTTTLSIYVAYHMIFNENEKNKEILYCSHKLCISKRFIKKVDAILYDYYGEEYLKKKVTNQTTKIELDNGNTLRVFSATVDNFRGWGLDNVHMTIFDEAAYIDKLKDCLSLVSLENNMKIVLGSSPNGLETFFNVWEGSYRQTNKFININLPYHKNPRYDEEWLENMKAMLNHNDRVIREAIYAEFVLPEPKPKKRKDNLIQFRVSDDVMNKIGLKLIEKDVTISQYLRQLIKEDIK